MDLWQFIKKKWRQPQHEKNAGYLSVYMDVLFTSFVMGSLVFLIASQLFQFHLKFAPPENMPFKIVWYRYLFLLQNQTINNVITEIKHEQIKAKIIASVWYKLCSLKKAVNPIAKTVRTNQIFIILLFIFSLKYIETDDFLWASVIPVISNTDPDLMYSFQIPLS